VPDDTSSSPCSAGVDVGQPPVGQGVAAAPDCGAAGAVSAGQPSPHDVGSNDKARIVDTIRMSLPPPSPPRARSNPTAVKSRQ